MILANFGGKPVTVLMQPVAPGGPAADRFNFTSPVTTVTFDQVKLLSEVTPTVAVRGNVAPGTHRPRRSGSRGGL